MSNSLFETDRLAIREFNINDAEFILRLLNEPDWIKYIGNRNIQNLEDARKYINDTVLFHYQIHGFGPFAIELKKDRSLVGMSSLLKREFLDEMDIGYAILSEHCGKGFASEASKGTLNYAHSILRTGALVAITNPANEKSIKILEKLNFKFIKQLHLESSRELLSLYKETISS